MKIKDVPATAHIAEPTPIPTKVVPDWAKLYEQLEKDGFVIIASHNLRQTSVGGVECVEVKAFNSFVRTTMHGKLFTKRLDGNRWFCTL